MIVTMMLGLIWLGIIWFYVFAKRSYKVECSTISKKEYPQRSIISTGLFLVDRFPRFQSSKTNYSLLQLYGKQQYSWRHRIYEAERLSLMFLFLFLTVTIVFVLNLKSLTVNQISEVVKKNFGEGEETYRYYYNLNIDETNNEIRRSDSITFIVPEMTPTNEEILKELKRVKEELPKIILRENSDFENVNRPLYLPKSLSEKINILWTSSNDKLLQNNGQIRYNNLLNEGESVTLEAKIDCFGIEDNVKYEIKLYKKSLNPDEKMMLINNRIKLMLSQQALTENLNRNIQLPVEFEDYETLIQWYDGEKRVMTIEYLLVGVVISIIVYFLKQRELSSKIRLRHEELLKEFPGFVNKFALLMNAGMTFTKAWEKIASDYIRLKRSSGEVNLLYEEMLFTIEDLQKGISEIKAYETFGQRCKTPEILRFSATVIQNIKKGSHLLIGAMEHQAKEAMNIREDLARKKGEKASTKLILPMGIMFIAILIIVITPALITLKM